VFLALESPLDLAGDEYLFTFHMLQHQLLMMVAAPLLLLGTPPALLRRLLAGRAVRPVAELVTSAPFAFLAFNATVWAWHAPALYEAALRNENIHILQHLTFLATAVLFWWPVIGLAPAARVGRGLSIGGRMAYLGLAIVSDAMLGFIIGFWPDVLYPFYEDADRLWGLSALADQQIGAAVMGAIDSAVFFLALSVLFFALLEEEERRARWESGN
jgi:cytochrome c oxidase assembly factor CtaG